MPPSRPVKRVPAIVSGVGIVFGDEPCRVAAVGPLLLLAAGLITQRELQAVLGGRSSARHPAVHSGDRRRRCEVTRPSQST
jgi:hypothetical protein